MASILIRGKQIWYIGILPNPALALLLPKCFLVHSDYKCFEPLILNSLYMQIQQCHRSKILKIGQFIFVDLTLG